MLDLGLVSVFCYTAGDVLFEPLFWGLFMKRIISLGCFLLAGVAGAKALPFKVIHGPVSHFTASPVLFAGDNYVVTKVGAPKPEDFEDLYWINLTAAERLADHLDLSLAYKGEGFAIAYLSEADVIRVSQHQHLHNGACGGLFRLMGDEVVGLTVSDPTPLVASSEKLTKLQKVMPLIKESHLKGQVMALSQMHTRDSRSSQHYQVTDYLKSWYTQATPAGREDVTVEVFDHGRATQQDSVIVRIEGGKNPEEVVILGSHIDSIAGFGGRAPGADDNASGTSTNMEIFRVIMEAGLVFDRTIEIHGYAAEERGLIGSQDIAKTYRSQNKEVVAMVQFDMNLYRHRDQDEVWLVSNNTNASLNSDLQAFGKSYIGTTIRQAVLRGGSSDHAAWSRQGYPAAFPFENPARYNRHIHTSRDTIENSGAFGQAAMFAKLGLAYVGHYGGLAH